MLPNEPRLAWNYLRVRGEYQDTNYFCGPASELPPRARRILWAKNIAWRSTGTTSACAENTGSTRVAIPITGNYLRVRGEY